jgi:hypothetical protein
MAAHRGREFSQIAFLFARNYLDRLIARHIETVIGSYFERMLARDTNHATAFQANQAGLLARIREGDSILVLIENDARIPKIAERSTSRLNPASAALRESSPTDDTVRLGEFVGGGHRTE